MTPQTSLKELSIADLKALINYAKKDVPLNKIDKVIIACKEELDRRINNIKEFNQ